MTDQLPTVTSSEECIPCFIRKTYKILEDDKYTDVISWNDEGTAIVIKNPTEFAQTILPTYFKHNNLNSFIRQLNMYDFHKKKTPDGEHVYYHELFQRGKKHLLKNIRRKNAESSMLNTEKSKLGLELVRTKQDIAAIINENLLLKKINREALATINSLETKLNEVNLQNQALLSQVLKYNEKEEMLKSFAPTFKRENPSYPLTSIDINAPTDNLGNKVAQTTTRIPHFAGDMSNPRNWNMYPENYEGLGSQNLFNTAGFLENKQSGFDDRRKRGNKNSSLDKTFVDTNFASDLSQQIVKNMDQELQYLKKLTSSNARPAPNTLSCESPDSALLGKRRSETDPGQPQNLNPYENINKFYKKDPVLGLNFWTSNVKAEGSEFGGTGTEEHSI